MVSEIAPLDAQLEALSEARRWLDKASTVPELADLQRRTAVAQEWLRRVVPEREDLWRSAGEVRLRCERRAGELLAAMDKNRGGGDHRSRDATGGPTLADLGINKTQSHRWQAIAGIPEARWEAWLADTAELTTAGAVALAREAQRAERDSAPPPAPPTGTYDVIYADPPWRREMSVESRATEAHYPTMTDEELLALPLPAADDAVLFLWAISPKLPFALALIEHWGFTYRSHMVWVKDTIGLGWYVRQRHEPLLIATRGDIGLPAPEHRPPSALEAPRRRHSAKPEEFYGVIETMYPGRCYLELFARDTRNGWDSWGNEL